MKIQYILLVLMLISCSPDTKEKKAIISNSKIDDKQIVVSPKKVEDSSFDKIINEIETKTIPLTDSTNFDNFTGENFYNKQEVGLLNLEKIYPDFYKEGYNYKIAASYKIELSKYSHALVLTLLKGEHEMESVLINYDLTGEIIDSKVISYDEIAEGWSRKYSKIENNIITIIDEFYGDNTQIDTTKFHINKDGGINQLKAKFSSSLRLDETILLNQIYTDTIVFSTYDDNGDYFILFGKKNGNDVSLIYNREWATNEKYIFEFGSNIKITWKMDSIFLVGDGETLDFREYVIDAEIILSENKEVKFLWRENKFDSELKQEINSIYINESFCSSIGNQEKAALGYVATFIGNECWWDGEKPNEDRSNLKCDILTALDLGYQCSDKHLGFLQNWFSKDTIALKELQNCGTMPYTATIQTTFDEINLFTDKENKTITVNYKADRINVRESTRKSWTQTDIFKYDLKNITLISSKKSELKE